MTIKSNGGVFGRNPTFNTVTVDGTLTVDQIVEKTGAAGITLDGVTLKDGNVVLADGKGIDFSATAGAGTSELFDDYEEGTWTPVISDAQSGGNLGSAAITDAVYTKIGRTVVLSASLTNIDTTGMTGTNVLYIQGLPFTSAAGTYAVGNVKVDTVTFPGSRTYIYCQVGGGNSYLNFQVGASAVAEDNVDAQHISSGVSDIQFSITYTAT
jgi:hypothetical protein